MQPRVILTDIEGTTSSISFVKNVLFPYARKALPAFVAEHGQQPEVRRWPHPLEDPPSPAPEPAMHYIRCALSYQNQLLADIKVLLEQLAAAPPAAENTAEPEKDGENLSKL